MTTRYIVQGIFLVPAILIQLPELAFAQSGEFIPPFLELKAFAGGSRYFSYQDTDRAFRLNMRDGIVVGGRATQNFGRYFALEQRFQYGENNLNLKLAPSAADSVILGNHTMALSLEPVVYLVPPNRRVRAFVHGGPAGFWFRPTDDAKDFARNSANTGLNADSLGGAFKMGAMYGAGFKVYVARQFGFRFDFEGSVFSEPTFNLASRPTGPGSTFIPGGGIGTLYQVAGGIFFGFGRQSIPPPTPPPPPPLPARLDVNTPDVRTVDAGCPGAREPIPLSVTATTSLPGHTPSYRWTVNGQPVGQDSPEFNFQVPQAGGQYRVAVTVSDNPGQSADTRQAPEVTRDVLIVNTKDYTPPSINGSISPSEVALGNNASLTVTPRGTECNGSLTYACTTPEGRLIGTPPTQFDSTGVFFEPDRSRLQTKTVSISCTVTDARGATASTVVPVVVTLAAQPPPVSRFDDVIFTAGNARVNNCGKRILLDEVYPKLNQDPDAEVILVGHIAPGESGAQLDRERVLNVVATLTAGTDTCARLPLSRIKVAYVGSDQSSAPRPAFCGVSVRPVPAVGERRDQAVASTDSRAQYRRVEIYLVPKGAALPDIAAQAQPVQESEVAPRGCPR